MKVFDIVTGNTMSSESDIVVDGWKNNADRFIFQDENNELGPDIEPAIEEIVIEDISEEIEVEKPATPKRLRVSK